MACKCIEQVNAELLPHNTQLDVRYSMNVDTGIFGMYLAISTERIKSLRDGKPAKAVVATYCPFCGKLFASKSKRRRGNVKGTVNGQV